VKVSRLIIMGVGLCFTGAGIVTGIVFAQHWLIFKAWALTVLAMTALTAIPLLMILFGTGLFAGAWLQKTRLENAVLKKTEPKEEENEFIIIDPK